MPRPVRFLVLAAGLLLFSSPLFAQEAAQTLRTRFATIHYSDDQQISDFLWRISGRRLAGSETREYTRTRVDEIVERVKEVLDMHPSAFHIDIYLQPQQGRGTIAHYSHASRAITAVSNRVTDGVLAHEIAHAVMSVYFAAPPPEKTQEILAQYVDQNLWSEV